MAMASVRAVAVLSVIVIGLATLVNADGFAVCTFQTTLKATDTVTGYVHFQQAAIGSDVVVVTNFTSTTIVKNLYLHLHTYGDLEAIPNSCWTQTTLGPYSALTAPYHFLETSLVSGSGINLFGSDSIIGRQIGVYYHAANCTHALKQAPLALCTVGLRNVAGHGVSNEAGQFLPANPVAAYAKFTGTVGQFGNNIVNGRAWFVPTTYSDPLNNSTNLVYVRMTIYHLPPNSRLAVHIHEWGDISGGDGLSAGLHLNPLDQVHGYPPNLIRHMGDLGNLTTDGNGTAVVSDFFNLLDFTALSGNIIGRGMIVHSKGDDGNPTMDPTSTGAAGGRLAKGVIGISARLPTGVNIESEWIAAGQRHAAANQAAEASAANAAENNAESEEEAAEAAARSSTGVSPLAAMKKVRVNKPFSKPSATKTAPGLGALSPA